MRVHAKDQSRSLKRIHADTDSGLAMYQCQTCQCSNACLASEDPPESCSSCGASFAHKKVVLYAKKFRGISEQGRRGEKARYRKDAYAAGCYKEGGSMNPSGDIEKRRSPMSGGEGRHANKPKYSRNVRKRHA